MTKVKTVFTLLILAVVGTWGFMVVHGNVPTKHPDADEIDLIVTFYPDYREEAVMIKYTTFGNQEVNEYAKDSPWERKLIVKRGVKVVLAVFQDTPGVVTCLITRNGVPGTPQESRRTDGIICTDGG